MSDAAKIATAKQYLRRKYSDDVEGLKAQADDLYGLATEEVTITSQGFEGGSASGQVSFPKWLLLNAIESLIVELDPEAARPASSTVHPHFGNRSIST